MTAAKTAYDRESDDSDVIMELRDVSVRFGMERGESRVLNEVSLDVERNEILGVVGESGSGKSMFASAMLDAVVEPGVASGEITYYPEDGDPLDVLNLGRRDLKEFRWEQVSMVFQGAMSSFNPVRPIRTHFVETLSAHDQSISDGMERARELLSDLYMDPERVLQSYPHELSGGMRQRTLIALSLLLEPDVLVMDEPTAALDLLMQRSIISLIEDLKRKYDLTIVFITHDLPLIADLADRLAVMYAFEFAEIGPANDLLTDAAHPYTRMLLKSTPNLTMGLEEMRPIDGSSPDPVNIPTGCSYHPRCPLADEQCEAVYPAAYPVTDDHDVHCHHWEASAEEIPFSLVPDDETVETAQTGVESKHRSVDQSTDDPIVTMDDVEVHFESDDGITNLFSESKAVRAVDGVDLEVYENDIIVLVGESGCGKTTLGKTGIGIQEPTGGTVEYLNQDIWKARNRLGDIDIPFREIRRSLQIVHQDPGSSLNSMRRVNATLEDPLKRWQKDMDAEDRLDLILAMLEYVEMTPADDYIERYPHQLSGGEQQRIALIRAMLMNPDVILADEPVSALDVSLRVEMMDLMIELQDRFNTSYLFVSHDLSNARYIAGMTGGRIAVMYLGEIVEMGSTDQIITDPKHPYTQALRWATPELDPGIVDSDGPEETPMRKIDIPNPEDPPRGCRYHTRCPKVIPPEEYDFEQNEWNAVMDLKVAIERDGFDRSVLEERVLDGETHALSKEEVESRVRAYFEIPDPVTDPDADGILADGIWHVIAGETETAERLFEREFSTVCQTRSPDGIVASDEYGERVVSCFLEADERLD